MRAREGLPDQLTAACFHPPTSLLAPIPGCLALCSRPRIPTPESPDESFCSNAGGETAIKLARATDLLFRLPSGFPPRATSRAAPFLGGNETAGNATRPPPPFNLEKFQRAQISGALERAD